MMIAKRSFQLISILIFFHCSIFTEQGTTSINNLHIWYETFGDSRNQPILLIMGTGGQALVWPDSFCENLSKCGFYVIRYDQRDSGLSTHLDYQTDPYDLFDLAEDGAKLIQHLQVDKTHIIGLCMGGMLGEIISNNYPDLVEKLVIISGTPDYRPQIKTIAALLNLDYSFVQEDENKKLSAAKNEYVQILTSITKDPKSNKDLSYKNRLLLWQLLYGPSSGLDTFKINQMMEELRQRDPHSRTRNYILAQLKSANEVPSIHKQVQSKTLVIQGSLDPLSQRDHGLALAEALPQGEYLEVAQMSHLISEKIGDLILNNIISFLSSNKTDKEF